MGRTPFRFWLLGLAVLCLLASRPAFAISPSYIVFYQGPAFGPTVVAGSAAVDTSFLWSTSAHRAGALSRDTLTKVLSGRRYIEFSVFWGRWPDGPGARDAASQHGRFYPATATALATIVAETPWMVGPDANGNPPAQAIPEDLDEHRDADGHPQGIVAGWVLGADDVAAAKRLGIPGT